MKKLGRFFFVFKQSLYDPTAYTAFLKRSLAFSSLYLFGLLVTLSLIKVISVAIPIALWLPNSAQSMRTYRDKAVSWYPRGLTVTFNNGSVRTNMDEPFVVPFPPEFKYNDKALITFDTKGQTKDISEYNTLVLVTKNSIYYPDSSSDNTYKIYPFEKNGDYFLLTHENYKSLVDKLHIFARSLSRYFILISLFVFLIVPFILGGIWYIFIALRLLFLTFLVSLISRVLHASLTYRNLFQLGLHGITFPLLFELVNSSYQLEIPFSFILPYVIWMTIVIVSLQKKAYGSPSQKLV